MEKTKKSPIFPRHLHNSTQSQRALSIDKNSVEKALFQLFKLYKISTREIAIHFVSKKTIGELHKQFFNDPTPTDCITFPSDTPETFFGEIFICPAVAKAYAKKNQLDPYTETTLYLVHGLLHLLGYGDLEPDEVRAMRAEEKRAMAHLQKTQALIQSSNFKMPF